MKDLYVDGLIWIQNCSLFNIKDSLAYKLFLAGVGNTRAFFLLQCLFATFLGVQKKGDPC